MPRKPAGEDDWRARDDMSTLQRAEEIKADKSRLQKAQKAAQQVLKQVSKIAQPTKPAARRKSK